LVLNPCIIPLGLAGASVFSTGTIEAWMLLSKAAKDQLWSATSSAFKDGFSPLTFVLSYAAANMVPSVVWETLDATQILTALGYDSHGILRTFGENAADARAFV
jgi:hypothetical protein